MASRALPWRTLPVDRGNRRANNQASILRMGETVLMPLKSETTDILGYYDASWRHSSGADIEPFAVALARSLEAWATPFERWPVLNREERTPVDSRKRAIIHLRDGDICHMCGTDNELLTVDHIIPRSAFDAGELEVADRSDNLISACWPCNEEKSNYERPQRKRLGVVPECLNCTRREDLEDQQGVLVYCGRCGTTRAPQGWIL